MSKPILALNSIRGQSGKDTLIEQIEAQGLEVHRVAFGDALKREMASVLAPKSKGIAEALEKLMHTAQKDELFPALAICDIPDSNYKDWLRSRFQSHASDESRSLRWHLQLYGTEYVREYLGRAHHWLDKGCVEVLNGTSDPSVDVVVVTDMRLPNEYARLSLGGAHLIRIVRNWFNPNVDTAPYHQSDISLMAHAFDALVVNEWGKPDAMFDQIKRFL